MAIITAKADAERAKQDAITSEQQGLANVMQAKYQKEVEKQKAVVDAQKIAEVAVIEAKKLVDVAKQKKLENEQLKLAAIQYEAQKKAEGRGDAAYKQLVMQADGALQQKLDTYQAVMGKFAEEFGKQKWVPEIQFGAAEGDGNAASDLIQMLNARTAKDLSLDMRMKGPVK
jgi:hypothetical protein